MIKFIKACVSVLLFTSVVLTPHIAFAINFDAEELYDSVFVIYSGEALGSGFTIGENCIVTNAHVVEDSSNITIESYDKTYYKAEVVGINEEQDIAVLTVAEVSFPYLAIADFSAAKAGDDVFTIGAPRGMTYSITKGGLSAKSRTIAGETYIQTDAPINEGNSGGPLLNDEGQVLGMNTLKMSDSEGIGLSIPMSTICEYVSSLDIELDTMGNVEGVVDTTDIDTKADATENKKPNDDAKQDTQSDELSPLTYLACGVAIVSIILNAILSVMLVYQKKKKPVQPYDPSERTDFEIDILE